MPELTAEQAAGVLEMLATYDSPSKRAELQRLAAEQQAAEARAEYERTIAESAARAAADPNAQELFRKAAEQAKQDRENMLRNLREEASSDTAAMVETARREGLGMSMLLPFHDCGQKAFRIKLVGTANVPYCLSCHAKRRLRCDSCGGHSDKHIPTEYCPGDQQFRCPECLAEYASKPLPKTRFLTPGMGG